MINVGITIEVLKEIEKEELEENKKKLRKRIGKAE